MIKVIERITFESEGNEFLKELENREIGYTIIYESLILQDELGDIKYKVYQYKGKNANIAIINNQGNCDSIMEDVYILKVTDYPQKGSLIKAIEQYDERNK